MVSTFWIVGPLLIAVAIALLAIPLWRRGIAPSSDAGVDALTVLRDQKHELDREVDAGRMSADEREARIAELGRRVVEEGLADGRRTSVAARSGARRGLAIAIAIAIPAIALPLYWLIGTPGALDPAMHAAAPANGHDNITPERFRAMLSDLKARLDANPADSDGWRMLGRGLRIVDDVAGSLAAYERAVALRNDDATLLVEYAEALAQSRSRDLSGKPFELIRRALELDPRLPKALAMAGAAEWAQGNKAAATGYWTRLVDVLPGDSPEVANVKQMLAQIATGERAPPARAETSAAPSRDVATGNNATAGTKATIDSKAITGTVRVSPALVRDIAPSDTLYVLARAAQGPRIPLAVIRRTAAELPLAFRLDDAQAMPGGAPLSSAQQVRIEARISKSGDAIAKAGDLRGESAIVAPGARDLTITIDQIVR